MDAVNRLRDFLDEPRMPSRSDTSARHIEGFIAHVLNDVSARRRDARPAELRRKTIRLRAQYWMKLQSP